MILKLETRRFGHERGRRTRYTAEGTKKKNYTGKCDNRWRVFLLLLLFSRALVNRSDNSGGDRLLPARARPNGGADPNGPRKQQLDVSVAAQEEDTFASRRIFTCRNRVSEP